MSPFTRHLRRRHRRAAPALVAAWIGLLAAIVWIAQPGHADHIGALLGGLVGVTAAISWTTVRVELLSQRVRTALTGLPDPPAGWTPEQQRALARLGRPALLGSVERDVPLAGDGWGYLLVTVVILSPLLALLGTPGGGEAGLLSRGVLLAVGAIAAAALGFAWRSDVHLRTSLEPLARRVADLQVAALEGALDEGVSAPPRTPESSRASGQSTC